MHGHWAIAIKNDRGDVVAHHEFENALVSSQKLMFLMGDRGTAAFAQWVVNVGPGICNDNTTGTVIPADCLIAPPRSATVSGVRPLNLFDVLTYSASPQTQSFTLAGSAVAAHDGQITNVSTSMVTCGGNFTMSVASCMQLSTNDYSSVLAGSTFTARDLTAPSGNPPVAPPPILVKAGQTIDVTVTISFS